MIPTTWTWLLVVSIVLFLLLLWLGYARAPGIFGFGSHIVKTVETVEYTSSDETGEPQKRSITTETQSARTVWEWLTVLAISAVIGVGAILFSARQAEQQQEIQHTQANDDAIQTYFNRMGILLTEEDLRTSPDDSEARTLARSRTLTILSRLDPEGRSRVLEFLLEAELIQRIQQKDPVINLNGANLSGAFVPVDTDLSYADLSGTDLSDANLSETNLSTAYLVDSDLHNANLSRATLSYSDLGLADLSNADLSDTDLTLTKLNDADLSATDLTGADLWQADLNDAKGVTERTLGEKAGYVGDTTMPDGHMSEVHTTGSGKWGEYPNGKIPPGITGMEIPTGEYDSDEFVPAFHFEVDKGWDTTGDVEATDYIALAVGVKKDKSYSDEGGVFITNPSYVVDTSNPDEIKEVPAPESVDEWVLWFQKHPDLVVTPEQKPVNVGIASGMQIELNASTSENTPNTCGNSCVALYVTNLGVGVVAVEHRTDRFLILDVGEETVLIDISIPADNSKEFTSKAKKLLNTIAWTGA
jgi:uncharacterized protein YjbI with pentapeptide repeats